MDDKANCDPTSYVNHGSNVGDIWTCVDALTGEALTGTIACYEDMPCWNPSTMGNGIGTLPDTSIPPPSTPIDAIVVGVLLLAATIINLITRNRE
jgi:hypothetical protein